MCSVPWYVFLSLRLSKALASPFYSRCQFLVSIEIKLIPILPFKILRLEGPET